MVLGTSKLVHKGNEFGFNSPAQVAVYRIMREFNRGSVDYETRGLELS